MAILRSYYLYMKRFILLLFTVCIANFVFAQNDFVVRQIDNTYYIKHKVIAGDSFYQLARDYSLKSSVLEKFNQVQYQKGLQSGQVIDIPLTETNFFKMAGLSSAKGFVPVYYQTSGSETKASIEKKFLVPTATFNQWNPNVNTTPRNGEKMIVGWLKYNNINNYVNNKTITENTPVEQPENTVTEINNESDVVVATEVNNEVRIAQKNTEKTEILNPRYIDPNAPSKPRVATNNYRRYTPNTPVKKEVQSIQDDSKDLVSKTKSFFKSGKNKSKKVVESTTEEVAIIEPKPTIPAKVVTTYKPIKSTTKPTPTVETKKEEQAIPNKYKNYDVDDKGNTKSKNVWKDFKNSFKVKDKEEKESTTKIATPKAVKGDPNKYYKDGKPDSKIKTVWNDFKASFKKEKKETDTYKYANKKENSTPRTPNKPTVANTTKKVTTTKTTYTRPNPVISKSKEEVKENVAAKEIKKEVVSKASQPKKDIKNTATKTNSKVEAAIQSTPVKEKVIETQVKEIKSEDPIVRNEIKHLSLNNSQSGRASFFFSGPSGGKFYVATNLASKGQIIKVVNPDNGKFVLAEVLSSLPSTDVAKGILLKLSDNAKMPLGQKNSSFNVKVNY